MHLDWTHLFEISLITDQEHLILIVELRVKYSESDADLLPFIMKFHKLLGTGLHSSSSLTKVEVLSLRIVSKEFKIGNSINTIFDIYSDTILKNNILVGEILISSSNRLSGSPNMTFGPLKFADMVILPVSQLWDATNHMNVLTWNSVVFHTEI